MKRVFILSLFFAVMSVVSATAQERFRIDKVLKEITKISHKSKCLFDMG